MNTYNPHTQQRKSIRLKGYDYSQAGLYFITICCKNRTHLFGEIKNNNTTVGAENLLPEMPEMPTPTMPTMPIMVLNDAGQIANDCWLQIPNHFPNAILHEYIIMPNHLHGIIELDTNIGAENTIEINKVENDIRAEDFLPQRKRSIGSIVKGFKIGVTKWMRQNTNTHEVWQRNYYEHIIKNEQAYIAISNYIKNNPLQWTEDTFYTE